jgi:hypothetical protein
MLLDVWMKDFGGLKHDIRRRLKLCYTAGHLNCSPSDWPICNTQTASNTFGVSEKHHCYWNGSNTYCSVGNTAVFIKTFLNLCPVVQRSILTISRLCTRNYSQWNAKEQNSEIQFCIDTLQRPNNWMSAASSAVNINIPTSIIQQQYKECKEIFISIFTIFFPLWLSILRMQSLISEQFMPQGLTLQF